MVTSTSLEFNSEVPIPSTLPETLMCPIRGAPRRTPQDTAVPLDLFNDHLKMPSKCSFGTMPSETFDLTDSQFIVRRAYMQASVPYNWGSGATSTVGNHIAFVSLGESFLLGAI